MASQGQSELLWLGIGVVSILVFSGIDPVADRYTWFLETLPVMIGLPLLFFSRQRFPMTSLIYRLLALHAVILIIGGYYTYAEVPLFDWIRDSLELSRSHDRQLARLETA
ncbi:MAG: DUF2238 domain-containing protein [Candidatus Thiodiazotropha sp. (ex Dulcina madagascariensis)]|nr:DUF2238 domain-containing protein [Candidatus Thiodiazotropha sp. (ex Dulcina madagascariensis)]